MKKKANGRPRKISVYDVNENNIQELLDEQEHIFMSYLLVDMKNAKAGKPTREEMKNYAERLDFCKKLKSYSKGESKASTPSEPEQEESPELDKQMALVHSILERRGNK